mmetsp:Transcript_26857/g.58259  ORF Transcript_26857/g.58259 Transcript_26857/m.58259 type:complete len:732 (-) Transcript_26857:2407-4602(-)
MDSNLPSAISGSTNRFQKSEIMMSEQRRRQRRRRRNAQTLSSASLSAAACILSASRTFHGYGAAEAANIRTTPHTISSTQSSSTGSANSRVWIGGQSILLPRKTSWLRHSRQRELATKPAETYFLPIGETQLLNTMEAVKADLATSSLQSRTSLSVAIDGTIIWYDQHEDGYEGHIEEPTQSSTEIWGDGNALNGCAPPLGENGHPACTDANDVLNAGSVIVLDEDIPKPRETNAILFDGGDRIQSSFPVAITRGVYSSGIPGTLTGGTVDVKNTKALGRTFTAPIGIDMSDDITASYSFTELFAMATEDNTVVSLIGGPFDVTKPDGSLDEVTNTDRAVRTNFFLNMGDTLRVGKIKVGDTIVSTNPVKADLITADDGSNCEMRWYSLLPTSQWVNDYYTPIGDENTAVQLYNPHNFDITVKWDNIESNENEHGTEEGSFQVKKGEYEKFMIPREGSGYRFYTANDAHTFFGVTRTEAVNNGQNNQLWGHALVPTSSLSSRVITGLTYGCHDPTNCPTAVNDSPSPIWLTPTQDADIRIDYNSNGVVDETISDVLAMQGISISDSNMSGATITAVSNTDGTDVPVVVGWGHSRDLAVKTYNRQVKPVTSPDKKNTVCTTLKMTATQPVEIRNFMFYVETTDCIDVSVQFKGENDRAWFPMCVGHPVWGQYPNATVVDSTTCTMIPVAEGESVEFRVQTYPSDGCSGGQGGIETVNDTLESMYTFTQTGCA